MRAKRKTPVSQQNEGAQMSSELESDRAMVLNLELREPMVLPVISMRLRTRRQVPSLQTRSEDHFAGHSDLYVRCLSAVLVFVTLGFANVI